MAQELQRGSYKPCPAGASRRVEIAMQVRHCTLEIWRKGNFDTDVHIILYGKGKGAKCRRLLFVLIFLLILFFAAHLRGDEHVRIAQYPRYPWGSEPVAE